MGARLRWVPIAFVEWSEQVSGGNFASLTDGLLVRNGATEPSPGMAPEASPFALVRKGEAEPSPVDTPIPAGPLRRTRRRELPAPCIDSDVPAEPRRTFVLSANEYKALGLMADKKGSTPQHLLRKMLRNFLFECVEQCDGSRY
jgi:hypothetical protein